MVSASCDDAAWTDYLFIEDNIAGEVDEWWLHVPTLGTVTVRDARIQLPYLQCTRTATIQGDPSVKLESYKADAPFAVPAATLDPATRDDFTVPTTQSC